MKKIIEIEKIFCRSGRVQTGKRRGRRWKRRGYVTEDVARGRRGSVTGGGLYAIMERGSAGWFYKSPLRRDGLGCIRTGAVQSRAGVVQLRTGAVYHGAGVVQARTGVVQSRNSHGPARGT